MAFENIVGARLERRWMMAFGFGLVHGFGFSFFLRDSLQFAGRHLAASLLAFNLGVELGQLLVSRWRFRSWSGCSGGFPSGSAPSAVGAGGAHGVALDGRARSRAPAVPVRVAGARHRAGGGRDARR